MDGVILKRRKSKVHGELHKAHEIQRLSMQKPHLRTSMPESYDGHLNFRLLTFFLLLSLNL